MAETHRRFRDFAKAGSLFSQGASEARNDQTGLVYAGALHSLAVCRAMENDHRGSLEILNSMYPLVRSFRTTAGHLFYSYLNSVAVELTELGDFERASRINDVTLATPYAVFFPNWSETRQELETAIADASRVQAAVIVPALGDAPEDSDRIVLPPSFPVRPACSAVESVASKASIQTRYGPSARTRPPPAKPSH
ncbi:MAG: hypothetical protein ACREDR_00170 [Blastocatellia bacterium]